jgi:hypothetical protein
MAEFPLTGSGFFADVEVSGQRLRLVTTETGYGVAANIYTVTEKKWIGPPHYCSSLNVARRWAEWEMREYLRTILGKPRLVRIKWICVNAGSTSATAAGIAPFVGREPRVSVRS